MSKLTQALALSSATLALAACGDTPKIPVHNYAGPQEAASIRVSDPQLYRRESLINERRDEKVFLEGLLADTKDKTFADKFTPDVIHQVELVRTLSANLGLKFSPAEALSYKQDKQKAELEQSIDLLKLEMKLAQLRRDAELLQTQLAQQSAPSGTTIDSGTTNPTGTAAPALSTLLSKLDALTAAIKEKNAEPVAETKIKAAPRDRFRDLQDYRGDVKAAINAVSLDELHDAEGNTLTRLNLKAVVLPGPRPDVLGMVRVTPYAPERNDTDLRDLYQEWLSFVASELNKSSPNPVLRLMGAEGKFFRSQNIQIPSSTCQVELLGNLPPRDGCEALTIVLPPDQSDALTLAFSGNNSALPLLLVEGTLRLKSLAAAKAPNGELLLGQQAASPACQNTRIRGVDLGPSDKTPERLLKTSRDILSLRPAFDATLRQILDSGRAQGDTAAAKTRQLADRMETAVRPLFNSGQSYLTAFAWYFPECATEASYAGLGENAFMHPAPDDFKHALEPRASEKNRYRGQVRVYDVSPQITSQRLSTATRVSDAVQMAAELAASLPNAGVGLNAGLGYTRALGRKADALERTPIVVGFAEASDNQPTCPYHKIKAGEPPKEDSNVLASCPPSFGWVLGPRLVPDPASGDLVFKHPLEPHVLGVDLSVPGWWPAILLDVKTAWAPQWQTGGSSSMDLTGASRVQTLRVPLPHNKADMQSLTEVITKDWMGGLSGQVAVDSVSPAAVSSCAATATLQVRGPNLWRTSAAYIGATEVEENKINVLPDMQGVAITFSPNSLPLASPAAGPTILSVVTPNGKADKEIKITGNGKTGADCRDSAPPSLSETEKLVPTITAVTPNEVSACDTAPRFILTGKHLEQPAGAMLGTVPATLIRRQDNHVLAVFAADKTMDRLKGLETVSLAVTTQNGVATTPVSVKPCPAQTIKTRAIGLRP